MNQQKINQLLKCSKINYFFSHLLHKSLESHHSRIIACGFLVGLIFSPFWIYQIILGILGGAATSVMVAAGALGTYLIWKDRQQLSQLEVSHEDRWLGHLIVISGLVLSPFFAFEEWSQRLIWMYILLGMGWSSWGLKFFRLYAIPVFLITMGLFPKPGIIAATLWRTFVPPETLERFMAWAGAMGLRAIGQNVILADTIIALPSGSVRVDWACSGFALAIMMAATGVLLGFFLKQSLPKVILLLVVGVSVALVGNVPRIMLMAMAVAYWGEESFEFWHGPWGGQIFTITLMTIYYYMAMAIAKRQGSSKIKAQ